MLTTIAVIFITAFVQVTAMDKVTKLTDGASTREKWQKVLGNLVVNIVGVIISVW